MKFIYLLAIILTTMVGNCYAAKLGGSLALGSGTNHLHAYRLAVQRSWVDNCITQNGRKVSGYWEGAYMHMNRTVGAHVFSGAAVLRLIANYYLPVYLDLGFGVAKLSTSTFAERDLGSKLSFEERLGIGILFGKKRNLDLSYRLMHLSNGYLAQKNHGLNLHLVVFGFWCK